MRTTPRTLTARLRTSLLGGGASLLLIGTALTATAVAAEQTSSNTTSSTQTTNAPQVQDAIGPHTHQLHGIVKTAPSSNGTTFALTTERFGDVSVSFAGATPGARGHARGHARSFEIAAAADLK